MRIHAGGAFSFQDIAPGGFYTHRDNEIWTYCRLFHGAVVFMLAAPTERLLTQRNVCRLDTVASEGFFSLGSSLKAWTTEEAERNVFFLSQQLLSFLSVIEKLTFHSTNHRVICICTEAEESRSNSSTFISISGTEKIQI